MQIQQSHLPSSPELLAIAESNKRNLPHMIDGHGYSLGDWQPKDGRILVTLVPFQEHYRTPKNRSRHSG